MPATCPSADAASAARDRRGGHAGRRRAPRRVRGRTGPYLNDASDAGASCATSRGRTITSGCSRSTPEPRTDISRRSRRPRARLRRARPRRCDPRLHLLWRGEVHVHAAVLSRGARRSGTTIRSFARRRRTGRRGASISWTASSAWAIAPRRARCSRCRCAATVGGWRRTPSGFLGQGGPAVAFQISQSFDVKRLLTPKQ